MHSRLDLNGKRKNKIYQKHQLHSINLLIFQIKNNYIMSQELSKSTKIRQKSDIQSQLNLLSPFRIFLDA